MGALKLGSEREWTRAEDGSPVGRWHQAVNRADVALAAEAVTDRVLVGGPKGAGRGRALFLDWVSSAGIRLEPLRLHDFGNGRIAVEQDATWPDNPQASSEQSPIRVVTVFQLDGERVSEAVRYGSLAEADIAAINRDSAPRRPAT